MTPQEQDERILAAIIAASHVVGRPVQPNSSHDGVRGSRNAFVGYKNTDFQGPVCAVGAGILYTGYTPSDFETTPYAFAKKFKVSALYAMGVSDGFESAISHDPSADSFGREYARGFEVGKSAFQILCL